MKFLKIKTFTATAVIGLLRGYSNEAITLIEFKRVLLSAQTEIYQKYGIGLSVKLSTTEILFLGQNEQSVDIQIIQYPKFPQPEETLKKAFIQLIEIMMQKLEQNRVVIVFSDETIMMEQTDSLDPNIQF